MLILQVNVTANWGSTGRIAEQIGLAAMEAGWESYIAYGRHLNDSASRLIKVGSYPIVLEHYVEHRLADNEGLASRCSTKRLIDQIKEISPDIIHLQNIHDHYLNYQILFEYLNSTSIPVVWTFHDCWAFTGHCHYFDAAECDKWMNKCYSCPLSRTLLDRSTRNFLLKKTLFTSNQNLTIVPVSYWLKDHVMNSFLKEKNIRVIHNGIDINRFHPLHKVHGQIFTILGVSNVWEERKGLKDFVRLRELLDDSIHVRLIGLTPDQIKQLPEGIEGMTRTSSVEELVEAYSSADVLVNPTYADTFPTVNLEALACGTPVITYQTGGSPEAVDENTGVVVPQGDVKALAAAVMRMKDVPLSRKACRTRAEEYFDKDKCFRKYIELYEELLNIHKM